MRTFSFIFMRLTWCVSYGLVSVWKVDQNYLRDASLIEGGEAWVGLGPINDPGSSKSLAIWCIFFCLALIRPWVSLCLAARLRMWSSKVKVALKSGAFRDLYELCDLGLWTVTWRHLESSWSVTTSKSCKNPTKVATPHPRENLEYIFQEIVWIFRAF